MTTLVEEPQFSVDSLRFLNNFQESFRARVYNLVEDRVRQTGQSKVSKEDLIRCIEAALREYVDRVIQKDMFSDVQ